MSTNASHFSAIAYCRENIENYEKVILYIRRCPTIASLRQINDALSKLTAGSQSPVTEIADVIRRDLSLTARLLRLVNSVFGGLSVKISSIEEAIFFLGLRQIRQLTMTTRVVDEMETMIGDGHQLDWKSVWRHSIATGILTREILSMTCGILEDDTYYVCGLLHDIGKLVMLSMFPKQLEESRSFEAASGVEFAQMEKEAFGWNHAEIGAMYLEVNGLPREIVESVLFHHSPKQSINHKDFAAGIQIADCVARHGGCDAGFEKLAPISFGTWEKLSGWDILFGSGSVESQYARASVLNSIERLPTILQGLL